MSGSLEAPIAKLRRAVHHYRTLKALHWGVDHKRRPVSCKAQVDGLKYEFCVGEVESLNPDVPLILGDAYHNLRAALDGLVFQLHVRRYRGRVPPDIVSNSAFPIRTKEWHYKSGKLKGLPVPTDKWKEIGTLGARERTTIEWLQPYKGWDTRHPRPTSLVGQLRAGLADIHRFDIIDKHQQPYLVEAHLRAVAQPRFPSRPDFGFRQHPRFAIPVESNTHVDTWTFRSRPPAEYMNMHPGVLTAIVMEPTPGDRIDVIPNLGGSIWAVALVFGRFKRFPPITTPPIDLREVTLTADS